MVKALAQLRKGIINYWVYNSHFVEKRNNFNLLCISTLREQVEGKLERTISEPTPPLNILPPHEYTSWDIIQLT
jgi:hypothetical protein